MRQGFTYLTQQATVCQYVYQLLSQLFHFCSLVPVHPRLDSELYKSCESARFSRTPAVNVVGDIDQLPPLPTSYPGIYNDFYGFPSHPRSIYKTGEPWPLPTGCEAWWVPKEGRPVCNHPIQAVWPTLGEQVYKFLDSLEVKWSTIDPVRFAEEKGEAGSLHLWVGVEPRSLTLEDAKAAAAGCKKILADAQFPDVEIAFRESVFTWSAVPQLLHQHEFPYANPIADLSSPFTPALGVKIAPRSTPPFEGTGALYLQEGGESNRVFLLTARHVVLPPSAHRNELYMRKRGVPRQEVLILGSKAYSIALEAMTYKIWSQFITMDLRKRGLAALGDAVEGEDAEVANSRQLHERELTKAEETITATDKFHSQITKHWSAETQRVLGYIFHAPPISVGTDPKKFTEDWALIELCRDKIDWNAFKGNVIYIGNKISISDFINKLHPHPEDRSADDYPMDGLLQITGVLKEDEIHKPTLLDANGEECLIVIKNGRSTGVTVGRGSSLESFVRKYDKDGNKSTSMELAIYSYSYKDRAFSALGDSGSIAVDGKGRIVGMITGGAGKPDYIDVTYLTPYFWLEERIKQAFPDSYLYPAVPVE